MKHLTPLFALSLALATTSVSASDTEQFSSYEGITGAQSCYAAPFDDPSGIRKILREFTSMEDRAINHIFSEQMYAKQTERAECIRFTYEVDGVEVQGFMLRPHNLEADAPVLVYHRGGNGNFGAIRFVNLYLRFSELAGQGYVVIGSNLREKDEFGGTDVEDSRRILEIVKGMDNVDLNRVALWGESRGANQMMQVARGRDDVQALVFSMGAVDHERALQTRPEMLRVYQARVPDFTDNREQVLAERSAVNWIEELPEVPILVLHGEQDDRVDVEQAHLLAAALDEHERGYTLKIYSDLGHDLAGEPTRDMFAWLGELFGTE